MGTFTESTVPGCRAPHFWLRDGRSVYDAFGLGYTLLRFSSTVDVNRMVAAAESLQMPLTVVDVDRGSTDVPHAYHHQLLICRPDQHVAWSGNELPAALDPLCDRLRGCGEGRSFR